MLSPKTALQVQEEVEQDKSEEEPHKGRAGSDKSGRKPRTFRSTLPRLTESVSAHLRALDVFMAKEQVEDEDAFDAVMASASDEFAVELWELRKELQGLPWNKLREQYRLILTKTRTHYLHELTAMRPRPGESMAQYHMRVNDIRAYAFEDETYDPLFDVETFIESLPYI